jgi:hypothetical protein
LGFLGSFGILKIWVWEKAQGRAQRYLLGGQERGVISKFWGSPQNNVSGKQTFLRREEGGGDRRVFSENKTVKNCFQTQV